MCCNRAPHQGKSLELRDLQRAIDRLPEEQRSVILLVGLEGMRYEEVAEVLGCSSREPSARACCAAAKPCAGLIGLVPDRQAEIMNGRSRGAASRRPTLPGGAWSIPSLITSAAAPSACAVRRDCAGSRPSG